MEKEEQINDELSVIESINLYRWNMREKFIEDRKKESIKSVTQTAERILGKSIDGLKELIQDDDLFNFYKDVILCYGEEMAKLKQERMYSEEEVDVLISLLRTTTEYEVLDWFKDKVESFKKVKSNGTN